MTDEDQLIRAIEDDPEDPASYAVYADLLTERGDPRGELITLQMQVAADPTKQALADACLAAHSEVFQVPQPASLDLTWRNGFIASLRREGWPHELEKLLEHPSMRFLQGLELVEPGGMNRNIKLFNLRFREFLENHATKRLPALRVLRLRNHDAWSWEPIALERLWPIVSRVREVVIEGRYMIGYASLPRLERLSLVGCGFTEVNLRALAEAELPALRTLELIGSLGDRAPAVEEPLLAKLLGAVFARLHPRRLVFKRARHLETIARSIEGSPILAQLESLELEGATLGPAFAHVRHE